MFNTWSPRVSEDIHIPFEILVIGRSHRYNIRLPHGKKFHTRALLSSLRLLRLQDWASSVAEIGSTGEIRNGLLTCARRTLT